MAASPLIFEDLIRRFMDFYQKGEYAHALQMLEADGPAFPDCASQLIIWQTAMLSRLGRAGEALQRLETAYTLGCWCHEAALRHDPDFESLQQHPGFADLVERMAARRVEAAQQSAPARAVVEPAGPGPHPMFLTLHGNYSNIFMTEPLWRTVVDQGWLMAALQSSQLGWTNGVYVWDDVDKSMTEVKQHMVELSARNAIDPQTIIAGGFSMGAHIAVRMALDPVFRLRGAVAMEAWFDEAAMAELEKRVHSVPPTPARVCLIAGQENAEYLVMAQKIHRLLTSRGMACQIITSSNPQHGYPSEFSQLLRQAVDWVMC